MFKKISFCLTSLFLFASCSFLTGDNPIEKELDTNASRHKKTPYVLLISIDGLRHDYLKKYQPKNLTKLAQEGVQAESLKPVFPTLTFPNHYSIATGLRADSHGIVANHFMAPDLDDKFYSLKDKDAVTNPDFYKGLPLWSLARQQGLVSATYFWPGSEAPINGVYPSYWRAYEHSMPHSERIKTIIRWFELPEENRPHFSTLYFSKVDSAGHAHGPNSPQVEQALKTVDKDIGFLLERLQTLDFPVHVIVTSDHGMADLSFSKIAYLDENFVTQEDKELFERFKIVHTFALAFFYYKGPEEKREADTKRALELLNRHPHYNTYKRGQLPEHLHFNESPRMGELVSIADTGWTIGPKTELRVIPGSHGFDPEVTRQMDGIFIAKGPLFKSDFKIQRFENIHIYPFLAQVLGLETKDIELDGSAKILNQILREK